ncbi:MAG: hypothetical protein CMJ58_12885 [Planctomycetaceae bacterium]|nr:hypothetical protein [Planctomycetaceae bacterium]
MIRFVQMALKRQLSLQYVQTGQIARRNGYLDLTSGRVAMRSDTPIQRLRGTASKRRMRGHATPSLENATLLHRQKLS